MPFFSFRRISVSGRSWFFLFFELCSYLFLFSLFHWVSCPDFFFFFFFFFFFHFLSPSFGRNGSNQDRGCNPLSLPHGSRRYYAKYFLLRGTGREYFMRCIIWPDVPPFREIYHHSRLPGNETFLKALLRF